MYCAHGTYPMQDWRCGWTRICNLTQDEAETLILEAISESGPMNEFDKAVDERNLLLNKAFRVVFSKWGLVYAVYNHDGNFSLLACRDQDFMDELHRKDRNLHKTPEFPSL